MYSQGGHLTLGKSSSSEVKGELKSEWKMRFLFQKLNSEEKRNTAKTGERSWGHRVQDRRLGRSEDTCSPLYSWEVLEVGHPTSNLSSEASPSSPFILMGKKTKAENV